ncbi:MAG: 30S ribosomal protein S9 [Phycisphaerae bacterium]
MGGAVAIKGAVGVPVKGFYWGTGRRKSSVARVRIKKGSGAITINSRPLENFFHQDRDRSAIRLLLTATKSEGGVDVFAEVEGGGFTGQAGAVVLGLARALLKMDASFDAPLRDGGFLTRDARMKERKKYGKRGARRSFQFSKR